MHNNLGSDGVITHQCNAKNQFTSRSLIAFKELQVTDKM